MLVERLIFRDYIPLLYIDPYAFRFGAYGVGLCFIYIIPSRDTTFIPIIYAKVLF